MASRVVLQVDKATPAYQDVLRHFRKCSQNANLDSRLRLCTDRHREKASRTRAQSLHNSTNFERQSLRENAHFTGIFAR